MTGQPVFDTRWLNALRAGAVVQPLRIRVQLLPLKAGPSVIGTVEPGLFDAPPLRARLGLIRQILQREQPLELG